MLIEKASETAAYAGAGTAVLFGLTSTEWQAVGVIGGLVVAAIGLLVNTIYKHLHYRLAAQRIGGQGD